MPPAQFYRIASDMHGAEAAGVKYLVIITTCLPGMVETGTVIHQTVISAAMIPRA